MAPTFRDDRRCATDFSAPRLSFSTAHKRSRESRRLVQQQQLKSASMHRLERCLQRQLFATRQAGRGSHAAEADAAPSPASSSALTSASSRRCSWRLASFTSPSGQPPACACSMRACGEGAGGARQGAWHGHSKEQVQRPGPGRHLCIRCHKPQACQRGCSFKAVPPVWIRCKKTNIRKAGRSHLEGLVLERALRRLLHRRLKALRQGGVWRGGEMGARWHRRSLAPMAHAVDAASASSPTLKRSLAQPNKPARTRQRKTYVCTHLHELQQAARLANLHPRGRCLLDGARQRRGAHAVPVQPGRRCCTAIRCGWVQGVGMRDVRRRATRAQTVLHHQPWRT